MTIEQFINEFEMLSEKIVESTLSGDYKSNNKAGEKRRKICEKMLTDKDTFTKALTILLNSSNVETRISAAAHCLKLGVNIHKSLKTLKKISKDKNNGIFCLNAEMTLKVYRGKIPNREL